MIVREFGTLTNVFCQRKTNLILSLQTNQFGVLKVIIKVGREARSRLNFAKDEFERISVEGAEACNGILRQI